MIPLRQSPTDPDFVQNPYPFYDTARGQGDLVFWEDYAMPAAVSHRAVRMLLTDRRLGRTAPAGKGGTPAAHMPNWNRLEANSMLELEPPRHTRLRKLVLKAFTSQRVNALAPRITALSHALIDRFPSGPFDLLDHFARPLPVTVIAELLGVPTERNDDLLRWSGQMVAMYQSGREHGVEATAEQASTDFADWVRAQIAHRRRHPSDDLLSELLAVEGGALSADELISTVILLLNAGHEATVHTFGNGTLAMLTHAAPPSDQTVEEVLRFDPPLHIFTRWVYKDLDCFGTRLPAHSQVACVLAAANRDPARFDAPHVFNPTRPPQTHMAFGAGLHFCVGAPLARLELQLGWQALFARRPDLRLAAAPIYGDTYHFHGLTRLMVA